MPNQFEHETPENLVEAPGEAERAARSLQQAADSNATLQGYFAINNERETPELDKEAQEELAREDNTREKGHPVP